MQYDDDDWAYRQAKKSTRPVDVRLRNSTWDEVEARCRQEGLSFSEWVESCIRHELSARGVFEKVCRIFERHFEFSAGRRKLEPAT
jgi:hypothetical protein